MGMQAFGPSMKPPPARGSVSQLIVDPNAPQPYVMGEGYFAGVLRHRTAYGGVVNDIPNPYLFDAVVYSGGGPVQSIAPRVDYGAVPSWYNGFLYTTSQLGLCPQPAALVPQWPGAPGWGTNHRLSGQAAIGWSFQFDKDGKKFASGIPPTGGYGRWVRAYDPRKDSTFPGGSGSHRLGDESTYEWTENPALHAGMYGFGRYQNGRRTMGMGLPADGIDWAVVASWANTCEANNWRMFGVVFEPGSRWQNLIDICAAGGAEPIPGSILSFRYQAPRVALDTITEADIADEDASVCPMQSYRDRINIVIPKRLFPTLNWELLPDEAVAVQDYIDQDGEERPIEWPFNFVKDGEQAAQLAAYRLVDARELHPIELVCMPRLRGYRAGDCLHLDLPQMGLDHDAIILRREIDPATMKVRLTLISETPAKHAFALGQEGAAPPVPALAMTAQERDETAAEAVQGPPGPIGPEGPEGPAGPQGPAGSSSEALVPYLSRELVQVPAYAEGTVADYSTAESRFYVMSGTSDVSGSFTLSVLQNPQALTVNITQATKSFVVTGGFDKEEDHATLTMRMTGAGDYSGITLDKIFSLTKLKGGYEIVPALPSANLFEGRMVFHELEEKLYVYKGGAWVPLIDTATPIDAEQIADGTLAGTKFASGIEPVGVSTAPSLPTTKSTNTLFWQDKLYRWTGSGYVATVPAADVTGTLTNAQIQSIAAGKITGQLTNAQIAALAAAKLTGQIADTQISDGAISTPKLAAGAVVAEKIASGAVTTEALSVATLTDNLLANGSGLDGTEGWADPASAGVLAPGLTSGRTTLVLYRGPGNTSVRNRKFRVVPGKTYVVGGTAWGSTATTAGFYVRLYTAGTEPAGDYVTDTGSNWLTPISNRALPGGSTHVNAPFSATVTIPAGVNWVSLAIMNWTGGPSGLAFTDLEFREQVQGIRIADGAIEADKLAANSVVSDKIAANAIATAHLQSNSITAVKIDAGAVTAGKLAAGSVTTDKITANAVTAGKIAAGAVAADQLAANAVTATKLAAGSVIADKIGANAITATKIAAAAVETDKIATGAITTAKIAANAITAIKIQAGTIVASKFVTDQGVDLAALVPGQFNTALSASGSFAVNGGGPNNQTFAQTVPLAVEPNDYITLSTRITVTTAVTNSGNSVDLVRYRNGSPTTIRTDLANINGAVGTKEIVVEDLTHGGGLIYYALVARAGFFEPNQPGMIGNGMVSMKKFFIK